MANVLPLDAQKHVWRVFRSRFIVAVALAILGLSLFFALSLLPSYLAISLASQPVQDVQPSKGSPDDAASIARAQTLVTKLSPALFASSSVSAVIRSAIQDRPSGVVLSNITYTAGDSTKAGEMIVVGDAPREKISEFRKALSADPYFKTVSVPVAALVGTDGGRFSMTLTLSGQGVDF